jgi:hypothetical protein
MSKEIKELSKRVERIEKELYKIEDFEKTLAKQELMLTKKISDISLIHDRMREHVKKEDLKLLEKELSKIKDHEDVLFENTAYIREIVKELSKLKESHKITKDVVFNDESIKRKEFESFTENLKDSITDLEDIRKVHSKKVDKKELTLLKEELQDYMSQIEHQNKMMLNLMKKK